MTIASLAFLGFALAVALIYNLARPAWWRQGVLLIANIAFLGSFTGAAGPTAMLPLLAFLAAGYICLRLVQRNRRPAAYAVALVLIIALFFWLKRYSFLPQASFLPFTYSVIGLSYIFFRVTHMIIDAHGGDLPETVPPVAYLNYVLNFTSLVSGPIQRYQDYAAMQLGEDRLPLDLRIAGRACERIVLGLFKVVGTGRPVARAARTDAGRVRRRPDAGQPDTDRARRDRRIHVLSLLQLLRLH